MGTKLDAFIHQTEGRMRVRMPTLKNDQCGRDLVLQTLAELDGVYRITANKVSGSITIHYDSNRLNPAAILLVFRDGKSHSNVIAFPIHRIRSQVNRSSKQQASEDYIAGAVTSVSRLLLKHLLESALEATGKMLIRKIFI